MWFGNWFRGHLRSAASQTDRKSQCGSVISFADICGQLKASPTAKVNVVRYLVSWTSAVSRRPFRPQKSMWFGNCVHGHFRKNKGTRFIWRKLQSLDHFMGPGSQRKIKTCYLNTGNLKKHFSNRSIKSCKRTNVKTNI